MWHSAFSASALRKLVPLLWPGWIQCCAQDLPAGNNGWVYRRRSVLPPGKMRGEYTAWIDACSHIGSMCSPARPHASWFLWPLWVNTLDTGGYELFVAPIKSEAVNSTFGRHSYGWRRETYTSRQLMEGAAAILQVFTGLDDMVSDDERSWLDKTKCLGKRKVASEKKLKFLEAEITQLSISDMTVEERTVMAMCHEIRGGIWDKCWVDSSWHQAWHSIKACALILCLAVP